MEVIQVHLNVQAFRGSGHVTLLDLFVTTYRQHFGIEQVFFPSKTTW